MEADQRLEVEGEGTCTVAEFIEGNRLSEAEWPGWTADIFEQIERQGFASVDAGNGERTIIRPAK